MHSFIGLFQTNCYPFSVCSFVLVIAASGFDWTLATFSFVLELNAGYEIWVDTCLGKLLWIKASNESEAKSFYICESVSSYQWLFPKADSKLIPVTPTGKTTDPAH